MSFGLYVVGQKGRMVLNRLETTPDFVVTYEDSRIVDEEYELINRWCRQFGIPCFDRGFEPAERPDVRFYVGWQYIIKEDLETAVVLHDSYLPEMKGFAPTPTALMLGRDLGATAFRPTMIEVDTGPIYLQRRIPVEHPMRLTDAHRAVANAYVEMIREILETRPEPSPFCREGETFSIWRDREDMEIDWTRPAKVIQRKVYALSSPLTGARTTYKGRSIVVDDVRVEEDMNFVERHPGKIWSINKNEPKVICGDGMLTITRAFGEGGKVKFNRLRERLGR